MSLSLDFLQSQESLIYFPYSSSCIVNFVRINLTIFNRPLAVLKLELISKTVLIILLPYIASSIIQILDEILNRTLSVINLLLLLIHHNITASPKTGVLLITKDQVVLRYFKSLNPIHHRKPLLQQTCLNRQNKPFNGCCMLYLR